MITTLCLVDFLYVNFVFVARLTHQKNYICMSILILVFFSYQRSQGEGYECLKFYWYFLFVRSYIVCIEVVYSNLGDRQKKEGKGYPILSTPGDFFGMGQI